MLKLEMAAVVTNKPTSNESMVRNELGMFLHHHGLKDCIDSIDDVVLSYVISILEDLGDDSNAEENIDVDQFVEMMDAYIPGFSSIDSVQVCEWMFKLASSMNKYVTDSHQPQIFPSSGTTDINLNSCNAASASKVPTELCNDSNHNLPENRDNNDDNEGPIKLLMEMFPASCSLEVSHCLNKSKGDIEEAAQLILDRQENGLSITPKQPKDKKKKEKSIKLLEDPNLKQLVVQRYSYQDTDEDKKTFKPITPKAESKKMIRYLDSRIVSTKGEKFTEIKEEDSEEMKKTYVNLKPARKYRFH